MATTDIAAPDVDVTKLEDAGSKLEDVESKLDTDIIQNLMTETDQTKKGGRLKRIFNPIKTKYQSWQKTQSEKGGLPPSVFYFVNFVSFALSLIMFVMAIVYLSLICSQPCSANVVYLLNIALMCSMIIFHIIYIIYTFVRGYALNISFLLNILAIITLIILLSIYWSTYNKKLSKNREALMSHKKKLRNLNIAVIVLMCFLMFFYFYELFTADKAKVEFLESSDE